MFDRKHKWSDWNITERGSIEYISNRGNKVGSYLLQDRHCLRCGKTEINQQTTCIFREGAQLLVPETTRIIPKHDKAKT